MTIHDGLPPKGKRASRFRLKYQFRLLRTVSDRIDELAADRQITRSDVLEALVTVDFAAVFRLFMQSASLAEVVVATGLDPRLVRELHAEYVADYKPCERVPAVAIAQARAVAAREKRIATERIAEVRTVEAITRERRHVRGAWVELNKTQTRKHLGEIAETTSRLLGRRTAGGKP